VRKFFKKYFIPHPGNEHKPHILRIEATLIILSLVLVVEMLFLLQSFVIYERVDFFAAILPDVLVDETNLNRKTSNVVALQTNPLLEAAARLKAEDMATRGYFAHTSPDGTTPWNWINDVDYRFVAAGENLAVNFVNSDDVTNAWMDSPGHRKNILNGNFTEIGIATAKGEYKGKETTFVVQFFGRPAPRLAQAEIEDETTSVTEAVSVEESVEKDVLAQNATVDDMSIEIQGVAVAAEESVAPTQDFAPQSSFTQRLVAKPRVATNYLLIVLGTIMALALVLKVFIAIDIQHAPLIVNGVLLLLIISSAVLLNQYISALGAEII